METERYQKELFEIDEPKKTFLGLGHIFHKRPDVFANKPAMVLTPERIIFTLIGIVMLLVLVYAFGVERGKSLRAPYQAVKKVALMASIAPNAARKPYTIVAATFSSKENASLSANRMKQNGFDSYLTQSGSYYRLCIGGYETKEAAIAALNKVKRFYKDAYYAAK